MQQETEKDILDDSNVFVDAEDEPDGDDDNQEDENHEDDQVQVPPKIRRTISD